MAAQGTPGRSGLPPAGGNPRQTVLLTPEPAAAGSLCPGRCWGGGGLATVPGVPPRDGMGAARAREDVVEAGGVRRGQQCWAPSGLPGFPLWGEHPPPPPPPNAALPSPCKQAVPCSQLLGRSRGHPPGCMPGSGHPERHSPYPAHGILHGGVAGAASLCVPPKQPGWQPQEVPLRKEGSSPLRAGLVLLPPPHWLCPRTVAKGCWGTLLQPQRPILKGIKKGTAGQWDVGLVLSLLGHLSVCPASLLALRRFPSQEQESASTRREGFSKQDPTSSRYVQSSRSGFLDPGPHASSGIPCAETPLPWAARTTEGCFWPPSGTAPAHSLTDQTQLKLLRAFLPSAASSTTQEASQQAQGTSQDLAGDPTEAFPGERSLPGTERT
ncbi:uncharacterized protein LOC129209285 [Grus americana]|uniref:uncharacterized protein LOC129209285 n=1 Tax=Grus americana TaxID=9117 RepID=UPI0024087737|nr:uncharacterized protein LOC129209285 [Grus americana]XP_054689457.1 uncharacterized protein LOC129209285 [Grus americana]XP_054689458.1 uncharacterized protein LOC129209285 [Grus americana]XP_054689459.1 uncharacterized protein LOC129209285 [Grus americana]XP_054689460.1 uncharacterized protein LOC129209285 [Grus americana]XP_054689461.1 uncharacterized protein LOC129209285 [Grus americana]